MLNEKSCKLYRNFYDIIHPSISRKNITNYEILLEEGLPPIKVFYPEKEIELTNIIIYIHGENVNIEYYEQLAVELEQIIFVIDYSKENYLNDCKTALSLILKEAENQSINKSDITIIGDFSGANIMIKLNDELKNTYYQELKKILLSPSEVDLTKCMMVNTIVFSNHDEMKVSDKINLLLVKDSIYDFINDVNSYSFTLLSKKLKEELVEVE